MPLAVLVDDFPCKCQMVLRTGGVGVIENDRQSVTGTLGEFDIALNDGLEHQLLEVALYLVVNLIGKAQT